MVNCKSTCCSALQGCRGPRLPQCCKAHRSLWGPAAGYGCAHPGMLTCSYLQHWEKEKLSYFLFLLESEAWHSCCPGVSERGRNKWKFASLWLEEACIQKIKKRERNGYKTEAYLQCFISGPSWTSRCWFGHHPVSPCKGPSFSFHTLHDKGACPRGRVQIILSLLCGEPRDLSKSNCLTSMENEIPSFMFELKKFL